MYGLSKLDLRKIQNKHNVQRDYLCNSTFITQSGQTKSLLDVSFSANHSERYYSEIINKINTINDIIISDINVKYHPIFITVTLDGFFRDFLRADFRRYNSLLHSSQIPNNERFGFLKDKIKNKQAFTIKDLYNCLNFQLNNFQKSNIFKKIKYNKHKVHYIRVCEPHKKDGVPHLHIMLYIPKQYLQEMKDFYTRYFPAPQNLKPIDKSNPYGDLKGFQSQINSAPAYILKYIFKSFLDVKNQKELDYLQAWYIKNRILRVVTSHSIVPAWVYRKMIPLEKDWYYLTDVKKNAFCEWSKEDDYIKFEDEFNRILEYNRGVYSVFYKTRLIKTFGTEKEQKPKNINSTFKLKYKKRIKEPQIIIDGKPFKMIDNKLIPKYIFKPIKHRSNYDLYSTFKKLESLELNEFTLKEYGLIKNELIKRNQIKGDILSLNDYNSNFIY